MARQVIVETLRALHLGHDRGAGIARQHVPPIDDEQLVAPDDSAARVHDPDPVGVAVEGDAELGAARGDGPNEVAHVVGHRRVGMVIWEAPVHVAEELADARPEPAIDERRHRAGRAVAGVDDHGNRAGERAEGLPEIVLVGGHDGTALRGSRAGPDATALDPSAQLLDLLAVERLLTEAHLEAVVVGGVVAPRHLDATLEAPVEKREVHEGRGADTEVDDGEPGRHQTLGEGGGVAIRGEAAVPADAHPPFTRLVCERAEGEAQGTGKGGVEVLLRDAPDIVLPEDGRVQSSTST